MAKIMFHGERNKKMEMKSIVCHTCVEEKKISIAL
ncbi:hypothetical protein BACUNI_04505 [Bacteroides uniformis ATCC 8492]|uniref:Uncharacterized protein n=1 Tax=Bacteroides uniformis (strain ATCC 8492 / DSM 6597 / CCUG 4942 / CIP 103695 / JCM 5828 / KCTC 5204 / NCTC 13054 / VPI 0061) TaxID=411479 RepID=A0ABC9N5H8_BACUC|nr:hypothetical protein BACUNI_04505 [Bacteroides uniformis ATCC 8492]